MKMKLNRLFLALPIVAALALALPALVGAHHVTSLEVVCGQGISASGAGFDVESNSPVSVTGPDGYDESFAVPSASWSHTFPIGPDGDYELDWPNSGSNGPVSFSVECEEQEPVAPTGFASVACDPQQDPGWILTYGANNPTDEPIEVILFLDGADAGVTPGLTVQSGHTASRFVDYDHEQRVTLYVGELVIFDETLPVPHCSPHPDTPTITLPPTSSADQVAIVPASVDQSVSAVLLLIVGLGLVFIALGRRRRTD